MSFTMSTILLCFLQQVQRDPDVRMTRTIELIKAKMPQLIDAHCNSSHVSPADEHVSASEYAANISELHQFIVILYISN